METQTITRETRRKSYHTRSLDSFEHYYRRIKTKSDWAGVTAADAFKATVDYSVRIPALRMTGRLFLTAQKEAARLAGDDVGSQFAPRVKPQIGLCYSTYPTSLSIIAAIGLTAYLEFEARVSQKGLVATMKEYLENPAEHDRLPDIEPEIYKKIAQITAGLVHSRLLLEDMGRREQLQAVEFYRLFSASQKGVNFRSLTEILAAVVTFGDIFPEWESIENLHPGTVQMLQLFQATSSAFFDLLPKTRSEELMVLGEHWVKALCLAAVPFLPLRDPTKEPPGGAGDRYKFLRAMIGAGGIRQGESVPAGQALRNSRIPPLGQPATPFLFDPPNPFEDAAGMAKALMAGDKSISNSTGAKPPDETAKMVSELVSSLEKASGQQNAWEDMRYDLLEQHLRDKTFQQCPIEGNPTDGHEVKIDLGGKEPAVGEIFDRPLDISSDESSFQQLRAKAAPVTEALRKALYPNIERLPETKRFCASGAMDPTRMAMAVFSDTIFRKYPYREVLDKRGRPVLLIACDGSGSLNRDQMQMVKILSIAWLNATAKSGIQVLAGLYTSGAVRSGLSGPLVQWMYHPQKTPTISRKDAARAIVSLPESGTGCQSDALSLSFMLDEAIHLARGHMIYMIVISDCAWNRSFQQEMNGQEEVQAFFYSAFQLLEKKLHVTLVGLEVQEKTGFESILDKVIRISKEQIANPAVVAAQISNYVAQCLQENRKKR